MTVDSLSLADTSTPKGRHYKKPSKGMETPYEKLSHQIQQQYRIDSSDNSISRPTAFDRYSAMETPSQSLHDIQDSPLSLKSLNPSTPQFPPPSTIKRRSPSKGPLLHRVLDNNWRLQATPLAKRLYEDALSSPPAPEITSIFSPSPMSKIKTPRKVGFDDSDDDSEQELGMSPPVTMQFSMPASKIMRTPARTAARNIVEEVLRTAGLGRDISNDSIKTPGRQIGRKSSFIPGEKSEREMWEAIRGGGSDSKRRIDVNIDGSPFIQKTMDSTSLMGGIDDRSTLMTMAKIANGETSSRSLEDWQESEDWLQ
jgi:hypothetical protein